MVRGGCEGAGHQRRVCSGASGICGRSSGFKAVYVVDVPQAGKYALTARVSTVQDGQKISFTTEDSKLPIETDVPYPVGMWEETKPAEVSLSRGQNQILFELKEGSRGVTIKDFILTPVK